MWVWVMAARRAAREIGRRESPKAGAHSEPARDLTDSAMCVSFCAVVSCVIESRLRRSALSSVDCSNLMLIYV